MTNKIQEELEKEIEKIIQEVINENREHFKKSNFDEKNYKNIATRYIEEGSESQTYKYYELLVKLHQHKKTQTFTILEFRHAYNKCKKELENINNEKSRDNNLPRDWKQRIDEILLIYSKIFNVSVNEARKELSQNSSGENQ